MELAELIMELSELRGPSGFEDAPAARIGELMRPYCDEVRRDALGNVIGLRRCGKEGAKKLLIDAHMDEIGLIVTGTDKGFLKFSPLGGVDTRILPDREVLVLSEPPLRGVIACLPPHILTAEEREKPFERDALCIDVGLSEDAVKSRVALGTPVVFADKPFMLGDQYICGKSLDDRACVAILLYTLEALKGKELYSDVYFMASTQEEVGLRGAKVGAYGVAPDYCVAVDVTHASTPDSAPKDHTFKPGSGAAIGVGPNMDRRFGKKLMELAAEQGIAFQPEVMAGNTGTNGWVMQVSREGVVSAVVSLPLRYMHTPVETLKISDAEAVGRLLCQLALDFERIVEG